MRKLRRQPNIAASTYAPWHLSIPALGHRRGIGLAAAQAIGRFNAVAEPAPAALTYTRNAALSVGDAPIRTRTSRLQHYYEFGTDKSDPAEYAQKLRTRPWNVTVSGEAEVTGTYASRYLKPHP